MIDLRAGTPPGSHDPSPQPPPAPSKFRRRSHYDFTSAWGLYIPQINLQRSTEIFWVLIAPVKTSETVHPPGRRRSQRTWLAGERGRGWSGMGEGDVWQEWARHTPLADTPALIGVGCPQPQGPPRGDAPSSPGPCTSAQRCALSKRTSALWTPRSPRRAQQPPTPRLTVRGALLGLQPLQIDVPLLHGRTGSPDLGPGLPESSAAQSPEDPLPGAQRTAG